MSNSKDFHVARELARSIFKAHEQTMDTYYRTTMFEPAVVLIEAALHGHVGDTKAHETVEREATIDFEPPLRGELTHMRNCAAMGRSFPIGDEGDCDCGLKWRIRLQTEMTLRNAWEKRAYEAEAELAAQEPK